MCFDVPNPDQKPIVADRFSPEARFLVVGGAAAAVHYGISVAAYEALTLTPWLANVLGFCTAFPVSYAGHRNWSFAATRATHLRAAPRFFAISLGAFGANQFLLELGLRWVGGPFWIVLAVVLAVVAASTYFLARFWAFSN